MADDSDQGIALSTVRPAYDLSVTARMRLSLKHHRESCCCPGLMRLPFACDCVITDAKIEVVSCEALRSISECARFSLLTGATGTARNSLWGLVRRAESGIVWIEARAKMLESLAADEKAQPWSSHDPRQDGESWEDAARRTGWLLDQQLPYL